jgi:MFS family permease
MKKGRIVTAVLCMSLLLLSYMVIAPLLAEMMRSFPNATVTQIQLVFTIPSIISIPAMLIAGKLVYYFSKKTMIVIGMSLIVISGILPLIVSNNLMFLYFVSVLIGIGLGVVTTLSSSIVSDYFEGLECAKIMGYQSAAISLGGTIMSVLSGKIATINWSYSYLIFLLFIPFIVIVILFLPKGKLLEKSNSSESSISMQLLYFAILSFLCGIFVTAYNTNIGLFIKVNALGGSEATGTVSSLSMLIGIPAGLLVGRLNQIFKRNIFVVAVFSISLGFFATAFSQNMALIYLGSILIGFGFAVRTPSAITFAVEMVKTESASMAIAIVGSALNIGNFVSPFIINGMTKFIGGSEISTIFIVCGICSLVITALYLFTNPVKKQILI